MKVVNWHHLLRKSGAAAWAGSFLLLSLLCACSIQHQSVLAAAVTDCAQGTTPTNPNIAAQITAKMNIPFVLDTGKGCETISADFLKSGQIGMAYTFADGGRTQVLKLPQNLQGYQNYHYQNEQALLLDTRPKLLAGPGEPRALGDFLVPTQAAKVYYQGMVLDGMVKDFVNGNALQFPQYLKNKKITSELDALYTALKDAFGKGFVVHDLTDDNLRFDESLQQLFIIDGIDETRFYASVEQDYSSYHGGRRQISFSTICSMFTWCNQRMSGELASGKPNFPPDLYYVPKSAALPAAAASEGESVGSEDSSTAEGAGASEDRGVQAEGK